jgi:hypothetical protein
MYEQVVFFSLDMEAQGQLWFIMVLGLFSGTEPIGVGVPCRGIRRIPELFYVDRDTLNFYIAAWKTIIYVNLADEIIDIDSFQA